MLLGVSFFSAAFSLVRECAYKPSTGQFGVFVTTELGSYGFMSGTVHSDTVISATGTGTGKFRDYIQGDDFVFPSDKFPGLLSGSRYKSFTYKQDYRQRRVGLDAINEQHYFNGEVNSWSRKSCVIPILENLEIIYRKLIGTKIAVKNREYLFNEGLSVSSVTEDPAHQIPLHLKLDQAKYQLHIQIGHDDDQGNSVVLYVGSTHKFDLLMNIPALQISLLKPSQMSPIYSEEVTMYRADFQNGPNGGHTTVFIVLNWLWREHKAVQFLSVERLHDKKAGLTALLATGMRQKFIKSCCKYVRHAQGGLEVSWNDYKYEDHWYWWSRILYFKGTSRSIKAYEVYEISKDIDKMKRVYEGNMMGKYCVWEQSGVKGRLVADFQWVSVDGKIMKEITMRAVYRNENDPSPHISIDGCKIIVS
jgi:hypothetical protein